MKGQISIKSIIILAVSVVGAMATFLPWLSKTALGVTVTAYGRDGDGWFSFALFAVVLVLALVNIKKDLKMGMKISISVVSVLAILIGLSKVFAAMDSGLTIGVGVYAVLLAGVIEAVLPWLPIKEISR